MASRLVVSISHVEFTETEQTFYVVKVQQDADEWQVRRAYTDFRHLRDDVHRVLKDDRHQLVGDDASRAFAKAFHELPFPGKRLFGSKSDRVVKERAVELHHFLIKLLFLTHTYRKAQKQLYEPEGATTVNVSTSSLVARPHGSASVFYLLRDFLKPTLARSSHDGLPTTTKSGAGNGSDKMRSKSSRVRGTGGARTDGDNNDDSDEQHAHARRMLRESRMLAMRTSQHKSMSAPQLQAQSQSQRTRTNTNSSSNASTPRRAPPPRPARPMAPEAIAAAAAMEELTIEPVVRKSVHFQSNGTNSASPPHNATTATTTTATTAMYARSSSETGQLKPRTASSESVTTVVSPVSKRNSNSSTSTSTKRFNDRISTSSHHPVLRSIGSDLHIIESIPDPEPRSLSTSSTASSTASFQARSLETATALSSTSGPLENSNSSNSSSARRRPRSKKKSMSMSSSSLSQAEKEMRDSQRLSRLTPQLTAQSITIEAQKELEKHVSEYNAIMIMRYVDRFISKAVGKTPGCYTVLGKRLVIDSARFVTELDDVFHDLPNDFQDMFKNASGEWVFPRALDAYVQMKWDSFQGKLSHGGSKSSHSSTRSSSSKYKSSRRKGSDSDDSDSDYEFEDASGGYMKRKDRAFTQEESDVLQMMIADGTAGKDQMLRLRRQFDEKGWSRRTNPNAKFTHQASSGGDYDNASDTDEDDNGSSNESFRRFQQQQNAMRKSRMSRHDDTGGLV